ncbi:GDSL-type esterase/lipase family protein [Alteromonadaceae bacterium BrNp21-10]|nr:GDSL-type esterase/lipase family protein [Alteromonadaceae bacterium BrNp21-10]
MKKLLLPLIILLCQFPAHATGLDHLVFTPPADKANGKHIVLISGDEEYRSEEFMPMLAKILSQRHGFKTTVLFAIDKHTGVINPNEISNIPNLQSLYSADLMVLATRWRKLPGEQLQPILDYLNAAKPIIALRTATHAFNNDDFYGGYDWQNFGLNVIGENWLNHHGEHKVQGGRGVIVTENAQHPVLNSVTDIFTWSDIYGVEHLDESAATMLLRGAVTESLEPDSKNVSGAKNNPTMPLAWLKAYPSPDGDQQGEVFATTAGAAVDFNKEDLRRLVINASYHLLAMDVPAKADVAFVDAFEPSFYGFQAPDYFEKRQLRVEDFVLGKSGQSILTQAQLNKMGHSSTLELAKGDTVVLVGNGLAERMLHHGYFETELQLRNPDKALTIRTLAKPGYTAGFRPHPSRNSQWAFPGAEKFNPEFDHHSGEGHYPSSDEWLKSVKADVILAFFGFNESFNGEQGIDNFRNELRAFIDHTLSNKYNGEQAPKLALVSPIAFQDLSATFDLPNGIQTNKNLALYKQAMQQVAAEKGVHFVDIFAPTQKWFVQKKPWFEAICPWLNFVCKWFTTPVEQLTVNGAHLNDKGYKLLAPLLADLSFGQQAIAHESKRVPLLNAVIDKNWFWFQTYQMPNGVHVDGRRFEPYGVDNYPKEGQKVLQMTLNRDQYIWSLVNGKPLDVAALDAQTQPLNSIQSNVQEDAVSDYRYGNDALNSFTMAEGYQISLFASEVEFPNLANPSQMTFDNQGRLWVSTLPSYPHYQPGDARPNDKILIYEDTDGDGKADKEIVFADQLNLPIGFEITEYGVYVSQAPTLMLLKDSDGDDIADSREIILSGFDTHDTHHAISGFELDPSGSLIMEEGVFLHTNVETAYGPVRAVNGGFYRFTPRTQKLQRMVQTHIPNPWGVAYDKWGQDFFLATSSPDVYWMLPVEMKTRYGQLTVGTESLIESTQRVRPTSGLEFIASRHFPEDVQGDFILNNVIGFLGAKQHQIQDDGTGYVSQFRQDLYTSNDPNFRPVDLEFAADGSLYMVDWHNQLIGHMQHNARDPLRDHAHGRVYRITYPARPLVKPVSMDVPAQTLFGYLTLPEDRVRYRARRALRELAADDLLAAKKAWLNGLFKADSQYERLVLEALWVSNSDNEFDRQLVRQLLKAKSYKVRAAAVRELRHRLGQFADAAELLKVAANDEQGRVRLEAIAAASWLDNDDTLAILHIAGKQPIDPWIKNAFIHVIGNAGGEWQFAEEENVSEAAHLNQADKQQYEQGKEIYRREGFCATCHQQDGNGLPVAGFPPLAGAAWVTADENRLVDIILHGIMGKMVVKGHKYDGHVPMTPFKGMLNDAEVAAVATYVRNAFGNKASAVDVEQVKKIRTRAKQNQGFWTVQGLDEKYPPAE